MKKLILLLLILSMLSGCQGLNTLLRYSKEMSRQEKILLAQQKDFEKIKAAIENNELAVGLSSKEIISSFNEPVVVVEEGDRERWVYRPGNIDLASEKAYLYFQQQKLTTWELIPPEKQ